jgi:hypothetical protein
VNSIHDAIAAVTELMMATCGAKPQAMKAISAPVAVPSMIVH